MTHSKFVIELKKIHWLKNYGNEDEFDLCAHGKISVTIGNQLIVNNTELEDDWWSLTATAIHLLRTLEANHLPEALVGACLVPREGHHINHHKGNPVVHFETAYSMEEGRNWWVMHENKEVKLITESLNETTMTFDDYKIQILKFVDKVQQFYKESKPKVLPKEVYDGEVYIRMWKEWKNRRMKWE